MSTVCEKCKSLFTLASRFYSIENVLKKKLQLFDFFQVQIINESIIKPDIVLKYALLDTLDFDLNNPPVCKDDLMSFFGKDHGQRIIQDENTSYRDEHSAPFLYQTKSQLDLCVLSDSRVVKEEEPTSPPPIMSELALSHSKVVSELKNALKSHEAMRNSYKHGQEKEVTSPGFISKLIGNFKSRDEERECLVSSHQNQIVASSENFFRTNFISSQNDKKDYRSSVIKSSSGKLICFFFSIYSYSF